MMNNYTNSYAEYMMNPLDYISRRPLKIAAGFGIIVSAIALLVACGGSGDESSSATASASSSTAKALAVPPGWVGRAPAPEVINGITVPPEPPPTLNNATLAGVDSNKNGVRDDVERIVAGASKKVTFETVTLSIAVLYNRLVVERLISPLEVRDMYNKIYCLDQRRTIVERETISTSDIAAATADTRSRKAVFDANNILLASYHSLSGGVISCN